MRCVARSAILLEPHVIGIHIINFKPLEVAYHRSVVLAVDGYGNARFILEKVRTDDSAKRKSASNSNFLGCTWSWCISRGLVSSQIRQICLFTYPFIQKWAYR